MNLTFYDIYVTVDAELLKEMARPPPRRIGPAGTHRTDENILLTEGFT